VENIDLRGLFGWWEGTRRRASTAGGAPMKHALRAVIAVALGAGLAAAAQAQGTVNQAQGTMKAQSAVSGSSMQSAAPGSNLQTGAPASNMQATAPAMQTKRAAMKIRHPSTRPEIRQVQLRLKSEGLLKGPVTGRMDQQTRIALTRFEKQNGLPRTASLNRVNRLMAHQTAGAGSSMQRTHVARISKTPKAQTTGVGSSTPTKQSTGATPITPPATGMPPASAGGSTSIGKPTTGQTTTTVTPATGTTTNR
jgi:hypothetical protein